MPRLAKTQIAALEPGEKDRFVFDSGVPGFGVKITPAGKRSAIFQYRIAGQKKRFTIGALSEGLTLDQAREAAKTLAAQVRGGEDPSAEKRASREAGTLADLLDDYVLSGDFRAKAPSTQSTDIGRIENHIKPLVGKLLASRLSVADVKRMRAAIVEGKTARAEKGDRPRGRRVVRGGEGAAGQCVTLLQVVLRWAKVEGSYGITSNAAEDVPGYVSQARDIAPEPGDYDRIFAAIDKLQTDRRLRAPAADCLRLVALTGLRRGEASGLRWRQVDLDGARLVFAASEHKGGKKSKQAKLVYLPPAALEVLQRQARREPEDLVFAPAAGTTGIRLNRPWELVRAEARLAPGFVLHGLRHALGATMAADGASAQQIAAILGHRQSSTAERYVAWASDTRRQLADRVGSLITGGSK